MPRPPRLHIPGGCYHVTLRGNHREPLFDRATDRQVLNGIVRDAIGRFGARVHAFCWMSNHLHLFVQIADRPLGELMQRIAMRYSRYRHKAMDTLGHLFERRHGARLVDVDAYFLTLLRYIHLNPVKAGIVRRPADYSWSSHRAYLGLERIPWLTTDFGLSLFSARPDRARAAYDHFICQGLGANDELDEAVDAADPRVLGGDEFISKLPAPRPRIPGALTLEQLAVRICGSRGIRLETLRSRCSSHDLTPARLELLRQAIDDGVATLSEVARFLDRNPSTLSKQFSRHQAR